jgi:hypothetical protein
MPETFDEQLQRLRALAAQTGANDIDITILEVEETQALRELLRRWDALNIAVAGAIYDCTTDDYIIEGPRLRGLASIS